MGKISDLQIMLEEETAGLRAELDGLEMELQHLEQDQLSCEKRIYQLEDIIHERRLELERHMSISPEEVLEEDAYAEWKDNR